MDNYIEEAKDALTASQTVSNRTGVSAMPTVSSEIENSLLYLLKHRINRVEKDSEYEDKLKQAIIDRLPEATFGELLSGLKMVQQETNNSTGNILKPFIPSSERVPLMDNKDANGGNQEAGDIAFSNAPKEVLNALGELNRLLNLVKSSETPPEAGSSSTGEGGKNG